LLSNLVMPSLTNLKASQVVVLSRQQKGLSRAASNGTNRPLTLREAEGRYPGSSRASVGRIVKKLEAANTVGYEDIPNLHGGRPRLLTDEENEAIAGYIIWMHDSGLPATKFEIEDAANSLRCRRNPDSKPISKDVVCVLP
ncbi:hypothetical protein IL306_004789, partial [Fusarium sp. DS 682]